MFANFLCTNRKFNVGLVIVLLIAFSLSGCGWVESYSKPIHIRQANTNYRTAVRKVNESFFTEEEKKVVIEQLDRMKVANLESLETKTGTKRNWDYKVVTADRLFIVAQARALRDEFLPASGLSDEEKKQGVKTCDKAICALFSEQLPLTLDSKGRHTKGGNLGRDLQLSLQFNLSRLRQEALAADSDKEAAPTVPPDGKAKSKPAVKAVKPELRQALAHLEEALAFASEQTKLEIPASPCQVDITGEIVKDVEEFLKTLRAG